jgi:glucose-6-phosphate 1-dehydrogenase
MLLHTAVIGERMRSSDHNGVEETWRNMQSLLDAPPRVLPYAKVSWGLVAADKLMACHDGRRGPRINS